MTDEDTGAEELSGAVLGTRKSTHLLTRVGFVDADAAERRLVDPPLSWWDPVADRAVDGAAAGAISALGRSPDPDAALAALVRVVQAAGTIGQDTQLRDEVCADARLGRRLINLLGISTALADHLVAHPGDWQVLREDTDTMSSPARGARIAASVAGVDRGTAIPALRAAYLREVTAIAGRDMGGDLEMEVITSALADLADHTLQAGLAIAATSLAPVRPPAGWRSWRWGRPVAAS